MKYKKGVKIDGLKSVMHIAINAVENVYRKIGIEPTCTSALDGVHMKGSNHYEGLAIDVRIKDIPHFWLLKTKVVVPVFMELKERLLPLGFDVVLEMDKLHIHIEWDPKQ